MERKRYLLRCATESRWACNAPPCGSRNTAFGTMFPGSVIRLMSKGWPVGFSNWVWPKETGVAIIGENCYEWLQADLAIQCCGGVAVGLYTTNSWEQSRFILEHSGSRYLFVQNAEQLDKWLTFRDQSSAIERVVVWDMEGLRDFQDPAVLSIGELARLGGESGPHQKPCLNQRIASLRPEHLAVLVYTSGTTGVPKGAMLSHGNVMWAAHSVGSYDPNLQLGPRDELLSFLPLCHIFERPLFGFRSPPLRIRS